MMCVRMSDIVGLLNVIPAGSEAMTSSNNAQVNVDLTKAYRKASFSQPLYPVPSEAIQDQEESRRSLDILSLVRYTVL
jgi:hypothetical protein